MKKGLISLLLIPTLLFAGCADNPLEHSYDIEAAYSRPEQEPTTDLPPVDNTTPFDPDKDPIDIHAVAENASAFSGICSKRGFSRTSARSLSPPNLGPAPAASITMAYLPCINANLSTASSTPPPMALALSEIV